MYGLQKHIYTTIRYKAEVEVYILGILYLFVLLIIIHGLKFARDTTQLVVAFSEQAPLSFISDNMFLGFNAQVENLSCSFRGQ